MPGGTAPSIRPVLASLEGHRPGWIPGGGAANLIVAVAGPGMILNELDDAFRGFRASRRKGGKTR